ncbi:ABC transporter permease [Paracidobacterium acidisoli]|uniref:ABC transporter permease n=1 Tax=Paracidobacterium acidisoli TaxID=2303751 RepID=A0A372ISU7_9BACT|nr:ABC transporter permease [Paracidobacterium acidisoli]MBT9330787.1 ABC transporter permease [Paracidobacterium acidisoli]
MLTDIRYALRRLKKSPGFTLVVVLTLAVGIGATTAIFSLVYDVLLRPLPYAHPEQLTVMEEQVAEMRDSYPTLPMNANHFVFWQEHSHSFQSMALMRQDTLPLGGGEHPLQMSVLRSTPGIFAVLAAAPQMGRVFTVQEDQPGHEHVAVLMDGLWRGQFHADPAILGKTITLNGYPYTVIGVMAPSFHLPSLLSTAAAMMATPEPAEAIVPIALTKERLEEPMSDFDYFGLGRLKPGVSAAQANAEINAMDHTIAAGVPADEKATLYAVLTPFQKDLVGDNRRPLLILLAAVAGLLLVGCINITNLLLARAVSRRQEMAIASALGASRGDMLRAAMRESTALAVGGGALGVLLAAMTVPMMQHFLPPTLDFRGALRLDWAGAGCAVLLVMLATLLAGAAPTWLSWRMAPQEVLHSESRLASEPRSSRRLRRVLVSAEVAVSVALVLVTGLLTASLFRLMHIDRGFETSHTLTATIDLPSMGYQKDEDRAAFYQKALERLRRLPGVQYAAVTSVLPLGGDGWGDMVRLPGDTRPISQIPVEHFRWISPGYFEALHLPLIAGRALSADDAGKNVAIVSEQTARTLWPGKNAVGQQFRRGDITEPGNKPLTVIGVAADARTISLASADPMMVYVPYWYRTDMGGGLVIHTSQDPAAMADSIRRAIWSVDASVPVPTVRTLDGIVADSVAARRFEMDLLMLFAVSALLLAGLGVYGVVTYSVMQRRREIGLRLALGAQHADIYGMVLRDGMMPVLMGAAAGIAIAFVSARLVSSLLFEVSPYNPAVTTGAICILAATGCVACLLPARRAASVEPMEALRTE